jgi:LEA14-like dessication related protein
MLAEERVCFDRLPGDHFMVPSSRETRWRALLALALLAAGCVSTLPPALEAPRVTLAGLSLVDIGLFEQHYRIDLRIENPNPYSIAVVGLEYQLDLNGRTFARGVSDHHLTVSRLSTQIASVEAVSTLADFLRQTDSTGGGSNEAFSYRVHGKLHLRGRSSPLPFDYRGEIALPAER